MPKTPEQKCPVCGYGFDYATCVSDKDHRPRAGDFSLCMKCGELMVFTPEIKLRAAAVDDLLGLDDQTSRELVTVQKMIRTKRPLG